MAALPPPRNGQQQQDNRTEAQRIAAQAFEEFRAQLNSKAFRERVAGLVPEEFRSVGYVDRLIESIYKAVRSNPSLLTECTRASLFRSAEEVAKRGLTVGDNIAWLVPYKNKTTGKKEVQYQLGYLGAVTLVMRSGNVAKVNCQPVFENDLCEVLLGTEGKVVHKPYLKGNRGQFIGCYSMIWFKGIEDPTIEWMDVETVEFIRENSPGRNSDAWRNWYSEMARGKCVKRHAKGIPKERPVDLTDMDDRMGETIEGVAEPVPAQISAPSEQAMPMDTFDGGHDDRDYEPAREERREEPRPQQRQAQREPDPMPQDDGGHYDGPADDGPQEDDQGPPAREQEQQRGQVPPPRGGPRRGTGGLFNNGG